MFSAVKQTVLKLPSARALWLAAALPLAGCSGFIPNSGPSAASVQGSRKALSAADIQLVELTPTVLQNIHSRRKVTLFSEKFPDLVAKPSILSPGDSVEVSVFEAQPASLFGSGVPDLKSMGAGGARSNTLPEQVINSEGSIKIPFAGQLNVAGLRVRDIEEHITTQLKDKANQPQVMVRQTRNTTSQVTIIGETNVNIRMPLTPAGERLLDAIAATGGLKQPVNKITLQLTRGSTVVALPLETIIADPRQNIRLHPGDIVTALSQPLSFTALGATGKNEEFNFEAKGITLAQALARAGGLSDSRSNSRGVFIFRFEDPATAALHTKGTPAPAPATASKNKKQVAPVIYTLNLREPASFFIAKSFPIKDGDTLYISNAPAAELQKFMNIVSTVASPIMSGITTSAILNQN